MELNTFTQFKTAILAKLAQFNSRVDHATKQGREQVIQWQDTIGHQPADFADLARVEAEMTDAQRRAFHFVNLACLSHELAVTVFLRTTGRRLLIEQHEKDLADLQQYAQAADEKLSQAHRIEAETKAIRAAADEQLAEAERQAAYRDQCAEDRRQEASELRSRIYELSEDNERLEKALANYAGLRRIVEEITKQTKENT